MLKSITKRLITRALKLSIRNMPRGPHITRYAMYKSILGSIKTVHNRQVLSIGHSLVLTQALCNGSEIVEANYPDQNWLNLSYPPESFDLVVSDQVLEHVEGNPQQAVDESFRVTRPGGLVVCTSCLINSVHKHPGDYWRFTLDGLRLLHKDFSEIIECGGWGSKWVYMP